MDCLYGKLNKEVQRVTYEGETTSTAETIVDNKARTIKVNVLGQQELANQIINDVNAHTDSVAATILEAIGTVNGLLDDLNGTTV